jgi:hypothetical protein
MLLKVCEKGRNGAPMVTLPPKPCRTSEVKKPDSCRRRCSCAPKKKVRSRRSGPPSVTPYCARVNGGFSSGSPLMIGANGLRDWIDLWRMKPKRLPWSSFVPDLVTTLTTPPEVRPNSAAYELVTT